MFVCSSVLTLRYYKLHKMDYQSTEHSTCNTSARLTGDATGLRTGEPSRGSCSLSPEPVLVKREPLWGHDSEHELMGPVMVFTEDITDDKLVSSIHSDHTYAKTECPPAAVAHIKEEVGCEDSSCSPWETSAVSEANARGLCGASETATLAALCGASETATLAALCGVSEAATLAGLYAGHAVKDELVVGPECLQPPDAAFALCAASEWARDVAADDQFSNHVENSEWENKIYRTPTDGAGAEVFRCCMCCATFARRPRLLAHAQAHVHTPAPGEELNVSFALALRECSVRLTRCDDTHTRARPTRTHAHARTDARPSDDIYECDECGGTFPEKSKLIRHVRSHPPCIPPVCAANTTRAGPRRAGAAAESRLAHKFRLRWRRAERVGGERVEQLSCDVCAKRCEYPSQLVAHKLAHASETCEICGKNFKNLKSHLKTHAGKTLKSRIRRKPPSGPFTCKVCKKNFSKIISFQLHERVHTGEKPYSCEICEKQFAYPSAYFVHMRMHLRIKPYSCKFCKQRFTQINHLKQHEPIHTGVKAFLCEICPAKFARPRNLKQHQLSHSAVKPHRCATCDRTFTLIHQLRRHQLTHKYLCKLCNNEFATLIDLNVHWRVHVGVRVHTCGLCQAQFKNLPALKKHLWRAEKRRALDPAAECVVRRDIVFGQIPVN